MIVFKNHLILENNSDFWILENNWIIIQSLHRCVGHTPWAPEGCEGQSQSGPKGHHHQPEVGAQRDF